MRLTPQGANLDFLSEVIQWYLPFPEGLWCAKAVLLSMVSYLILPTGQCIGVQIL